MHRIYIRTYVRENKTEGSTIPYGTVVELIGEDLLGFTKENVGMRYRTGHSIKSRGTMAM